MTASCFLLLNPRPDWQYKDIHKSIHQLTKTSASSSGEQNTQDHTDPCSRGFISTAFFNSARTLVDPLFPAAYKANTEELKYGRKPVGDLGSKSWDFPCNFPYEARTTELEDSLCI
ncbi:uncharacterized protein LOC144327022 isoform X1 [Podarcis muralis]